jgi:hypothetical protein
MVVAAVVTVASVISRGSRDSRRDDALAFHAIDAGAIRSIDATPTIAELRIASDPEGANISIDGISRGPAPLTLRLPVGAAIEIWAESPGHQQVRRSVTVTASPAVVWLALPRIIDTVAPLSSDMPSTTTPLKRDRSAPRDGRKKPESSGSGSGSDSAFTPNDVL